MTVRRTAARLFAPPIAAGLALLSAPTPASAHVTLTPSTTAAGAFTVLTLSVPHGCEGSPTTRVALQIPEEILSVTPTRNPLWDVRVETATLDQPLTDAHGNSVTERDAVVVYTARTPLPDGFRDAFELSLQLPDAEGMTLAFPAIQTCEKGKTAWAEVAGDGQDSEELEHPAPTVTITPAEGGEHAAPTVQASEDDDSEMLGGIGLGVGALGLLAGGTALVQVRRRS